MTKSQRESGARMTVRKGYGKEKEGHPDRTMGR